MRKLLSSLFLIASLTMPVASSAAKSPFIIKAPEKPLSLRPGETQTARFAVEFPKDHYLYTEQTKLTLQAEPPIYIESVTFPKSKTKMDPYLKKKVKIYPAPFVIEAQVRAARDAKPQDYPIDGRFYYQGCNKQLCYLPTSTPVTLSTTVAGAPVNRWDFFALAQQSLAIALFFAFLGGLLSALTPCVYPMIPITVAVIGARDVKRRVDALILSLIFVLGIALVYSILGVLAASTGALLGAALQRPWVIITVSLVFIIMGTSMLGLFNIRLPTGVSRVLASSHGGVFVTGMISGIVVAPCAGPVIVALLAFVATTASMTKGFLLLFSYALGLGTLFVFLGTFSNLLLHLPKAGGWMESIKRVFGLILVACGLYYASPAIPKAVLYLSQVALLILVGFLCRKNQWFGKQTSNFVYFFSIAFAGFIFFTALIPATAPYFGYQTNQKTAAPAWIPNIDEGLKRAKAERKPLIVDFSAEWCIACKELDARTFSQPEVIELSKKFIAVKVDFTNLNEETERLTLKYQTYALPYVILMSSDGSYREEDIIRGFVTKEQLLPMMQRVLNRNR